MQNGLTPILLIVFTILIGTVILAGLMHTHLFTTMHNWHVWTTNQDDVQY